jgi:hypothetical protein
MTSRARPGVGDTRKTRQPLKIDKLPKEWRDQIQKYRAQGSTWSEIEELSRGFEWDKLATDVLEHFPDLRIPESNLVRWYDLRVEQVRKETMAQAEQARVIAEAFAGARLDGTNDAVMNAMRDQVFMITQSAADSDKAKLLAGLKDLSLLLARLQRIDLQKQRLEIENQKVDIARQKLTLVSSKVKGLKGDVAKKKVTADELQQRLDEIYGITAH